MTTVRRGGGEYKVPWFCIKAWECVWWQGDSSKYTETLTYTGSLDQACDAHKFQDGADTCCFGPNVRDFRDIGDWEQLGLTGTDDLGKALDIYTNEMATEGMLNVEIDLFRRYEICAVKPKGGEKGFTLYSVWFCVQPSLCNDMRPGYEPEPQEFNFCENNPMVEPSIEVILKGPQICCNVLGLELPDLDRENLRLHIKSIPTYAKYVPGFRSTFQCEIYSRLSCGGVHDMCPYRHLYKDKEARPMEAYHQVVVGMFKRRTNMFYCQGTLVSRYFILSAADCATYDGTLANIVVVGDYKLRSTNEQYSEELLTYIVEHHAQRHYHTHRKVPLPQAHDDKEIILFKVWRPILLTPFRRPACINYQLDFGMLEWHKDGSALFTGYGSTHPGGGMNTTVKRFLMQTYNSTSTQCYSSSSLLLRTEPRDLQERAVDFCTTSINEVYREHYNAQSIDPRKPWGPCEFDLGGPLLKLKTVPYCQLQVLGVMTLARSTDCLAESTPYRFRSIEPLRKWLEDTIYNDDFYLYDLDFSWPSCDRHNWFFLNATYMTRGYTEFFLKRYEKP